MKDVKELHHIAIIMDGNGRWAQKKGEERIVGHFYGRKKFEEMCSVVFELGIKHFTVYTFSTENWKRPKIEVDAIMDLFAKYLESCLELADKFTYKVDVIGNKNQLSEKLINLINKVENETKSNDGLNIHLAVNYGGRDEIVRAVDKIISLNQIGELIVSSEDLIKRNLDCANIPDPDILIRTGGEQRLSNFMLWELAYSELFFVNTYWPDFTKEELIDIINQYKNRERRFGDIKK